MTVTLLPLRLQQVHAVPAGRSGKPVWAECLSYHGGHHPAHVDGVASPQVVPLAVLLVLGTDLEQVHAGLQNARLILRTRRNEEETLKAGASESFGTCSISSHIFVD